MKRSQASGELFSVLLHLCRYQVAEGAERLDFELFLAVIVLVLQSTEQIEQIGVDTTGFYSRLQLLLLVRHLSIIMACRNLQKHSELVHQFGLMGVVGATIPSIIEVLLHPHDLFLIWDYMLANIIEYLVITRHM